jgi:hypothetical protein
MYDDALYDAGRPKESEVLTFETPALALEAMKVLFSKEADFRCTPVENQGWIITVFDRGRPFADDLKGNPSESVNSEHMGRVLAARKEKLDGQD